MTLVISRGFPAFSVHPAAWIGLFVLAGIYIGISRRWPASALQARRFIIALLLLGIVTTWPVADLATNALLWVLVLQRLVIMLAVSPLLLIALSRRALAHFTKRAIVDEFFLWIARPFTAIFIVTIAAVVTLFSPVVDACAHHLFARIICDVVLLGAGFVLWLPVLPVLPAAPRRNAILNAAYLVAQSIVPSFLSLVWIFARHPLYRAFAGTPALVFHPLTNQQIAGFVAKLGTIVVLWSVAFVLLRRAPHDEADSPQPTPLTWIDVERSLERAERYELRARRYDNSHNNDGQKEEGS
jgi:cytochrome c oxidase assembly factor CtaG